MLNEEQGYEQNKNDFDEINGNIEKMGFYSIPPTNNEVVDEKEKIPLREKLIIFACGFSYAGFLVLEILWVLLFRNVFSDEATLNVVITSAVYFSLFGIFLYFVFKHKKYFVSKLKDPTKYLNGIIFGIIIIGVEIVVAMLMDTILPADVNGNQQSIMDITSAYPILMFFVTVIIGPFCEEMTYRVGLFEAIKEKNEKVALFATSLIFAAIHISFTDTTIQAELNAFPVYVAIGFGLTYAYKKHGLACSYIAHAFLNLISFLSILSQL